MAAVENGDARKLAELIRQDPGFNVNMDHGYGRQCEELWWMVSLLFSSMDAPPVLVRC